MEGYGLAEVALFLWLSVSPILALLDGVSRTNTTSLRSYSFVSARVTFFVCSKESNQRKGSPIVRPSAS
jgi:hypothetical protein